MLFPCELIVKKILPAFRAYIVKELYETYNMKQSDIAKCLGITQPSVSLYISGERGGFEDVFKETEVADNLSILDELSESLANEKCTEEKFMEDICELCASFRRAGAYCKIHKDLDKNRNDNCRLCELHFGKKE